MEPARPADRRPTGQVAEPVPPATIPHRAAGSWHVRLLSLDEPMLRLWQQVLLGSLTAGVCTLICWPLARFFPLAELVMIYLLGVILASTRLAPMASALTAVFCAASFDFFFVIPRFNFVPSDLKHLATVIGLLVVGLVISSLTGRLRHQVDVVRWESSRISALYALSRELARTPMVDALARVAVDQVDLFFRRPSFLFLKDDGGKLVVAATSGDLSFLGEDPVALLRSVAEGVDAMGGTEVRSLPATGNGECHDQEQAVAVCVPLLGVRGRLGALGVVSTVSEHTNTRPLVEQLELFAAQTALSIERAHLEMEAEEARIHAERERLRSALLSSVSHDLRTPLGAITGISSALLEDQALFESREGRELLSGISEEADRLNRLVSNLLEMTRLEAGAIEPKKEWQPVEEVIGAALNRLGPELEGRLVSVHLQAHLPPVRIDGVLMEQALRNVVDNAYRYTSPGDLIDIRAEEVADGVRITVGDRGCGLPPGDETRIFDKFYRGLEAEAGRSGVGLGLAVARGIVEAHGGRIWAENREGGGALFHILIPPSEMPDDLRLVQESEEGGA